MWSWFSISTTAVEPFELVSPTADGDEVQYVHAGDLPAIPKPPPLPQMAGKKMASYDDVVLELKAALRRREQLMKEERLLNLVPNIVVTGSRDEVFVDTHKSILRSEAVVILQKMSSATPVSAESSETISTTTNVATSAIPTVLAITDSSTSMSSNVATQVSETATQLSNRSTMAMV